MESTITKREFELYEQVRVSGITNMFNAEMVSQLSGLTKGKVIQIMRGYTELTEAYPDVRRVS